MSSKWSSWNPDFVRNCFILKNEVVVDKLEFILYNKIMDRPQAVDRPRTAVRDSPLTPHVLVELAISINRKMAEQFPKDAHADITIQIKDKRYELQKALLRIEAPYFD